ncbi:hypothetical protein GCM10009630_08710 [Kribbella jejuensis]
MFGVVAPVLMIVQAVGSRRLEDILTAIFFVVVLLPPAIAPTAYRSRLAALDKHLVPSTILMFIVLLCSLFVLLTEFLSRSVSLYVAVTAALVLTAVGAVLHSKRLRSAE